MRSTVFSIVFVLATQVASAQGYESLRYVDAFGVTVEELPDELRDVGLSARQLQTDVELRLRLADIRVTADPVGYVYLNVNGLKSGEHLYVYSVKLEVLQEAMLKVDALRRVDWSEDRSMAGLIWQSTGEGDSAITAQTRLDWSFDTQVTTWDRGMIGTVGTQRDPVGKIRQSVRDLVDQFVNDYLAVQQERKEIEELLQKLDEEQGHEKEGTGESEEGI